MAALNPRESDPSRAYRIIESRLSVLEALRPVSAGSATFTLSSATTDVSDDAVETGDVVMLTPTSAASAAVIAQVYVSAVSAGQFTITHDNSATVGRTVNYLVVRG